MLCVENLSKTYVTGETETHALQGVTLQLNKGEFVAVLGESGCGKTTLLNILGGLDRCSGGTVYVDGCSTADFTPRDWDAYRGRRVGFIFQNYNLIPHLSVAANVELAMTLTGVPAGQRRKKALRALEQVGLQAHRNKKPNQLSGGQMQRVAIARAIVNEPDILLCDEPTGALDEATSEQVMTLLQKFADDKLVLMVTHNTALADRYATRIIRLQDGAVVQDSSPAAPQSGQDCKKPPAPTRLSFFTAVQLSFKNLLTKKARSLLTAFAGSIGIIGIALILALSAGSKNYIAHMEEGTLSGYPLTISKTSVAADSVLQLFFGKESAGTDHGSDRVYTRRVLSSALESLVQGTHENDLQSFWAYLQNSSDISALCSDIRCTYGVNLNIYAQSLTDGPVMLSPETPLSRMNLSSYLGDAVSGAQAASFSGINIWHQLPQSDGLLQQQYQLIAGKMPAAYNELVLIVDENNEISDYTLVQLGLQSAQSLQNGEAKTEISYEDILSLQFRLLTDADYYAPANGVYQDMRADEDYLLSALQQSETLQIVGILRVKPGSAGALDGGTVGYLASLNDHIIEKAGQSAAAAAQIASPQTDIFTGMPFFDSTASIDALTMEQAMAFLQQLPQAQQQQYTELLESLRQAGMSDDEILQLLKNTLQAKATDATYAGNLKKLGAADVSVPESILLYPKDFAAKEELTRQIELYNAGVAQEQQISYSDYIGMVLSGVNSIIDTCSGVLIAFVAVSLLVSAIMTGIITYISVLERTGEIGILRALGASRQDVGLVFCAETVITGFFSGLCGAVLAFLLTFPVNWAIQNVTGAAGIAKSSFAMSALLIGVSMLLSLLSGLLPARTAANKDPVLALHAV